MTASRAEPVILRVEAGNRIARVSYTLALIGALVGVTLIALIAGALSGLWRTIALALLTPVLVISILALWRAARAVSELSARRRRTLAELQRRGIIGIVARPEIGAWEERLQRNLLLPAGPTIWSVGPGEIDTPQGRQRLSDLYILLGQARGTSTALPLPAHATLVLVDSAEPVVTMWDLSLLFERCDSGDDAAFDDLANVEDETTRLAMAATGQSVEARRRAP